MIITKPHLYKKLFKSWRLALFIAIPWIVPNVGLMICIISGIGELGYDAGDFACTAIDTPCNRFALSLFITLIGFPTPLVVIIISYVWIYVYLNRHFEKQRLSYTDTSTQDVSTDSIPAVSSIETEFNGPDRLSRQDPSHIKILATRQKKRALQQQVKITKNLFTVVCGFLLCFLPYFILIFVDNSEHILFYIKVITYANCAINFPIYSLKHPDFKVVLQCMIQRSFDEIPQPSKFLKFFLSKKI